MRDEEWIILVRGGSCMGRILKILTPENVNIEFELAGLGSRFVAVIIDTLIQIGICILIIIGMLIGGIDFKNIDQSSSLIIAVGIVLLFVVFFGYFIFFEIIMRGQSPGKKAAGLRVIKQNGEPVGFYESFIRNILRIIDLMPSLYLIGSSFILFGRNCKRIGDYAANTIVVKVQKEERPLNLEDLLNNNFSLDESESRVNIYQVNNFEYGILKEFLARKDNLGARKPIFIFHLNKYFVKKFNIEKPYSNPVEFFEQIVKVNSGT